MNKEAKAESFRGLSIAALVTGILTWTIGSIMSDYAISYVPVSQLISDISGYTVAEIISLVFVSVVIGLGLPISAVICGSIDLNRIQAGQLSNKGRGFDIAGIVLGAVYLITRVLEEFGLVQIAYDDWISITT